MNKLVALLFSTSIWLASHSVSASLIVNGGFEETDVKTNTWKWFTSDKVQGWNGSNIEIWDSYSNVDAFEGSQFAELNAHPSNGQAFSIFQTIGTEIGIYYDLSFAYRARKNNNEAFLFSLIKSDSDLLDMRFDDHTDGKWSTFNLNFEATSMYTTVMFTSLTPSSGTVGNFLDDISLTRSSSGLASSISEPSTFMIILMGLGLLVGRRQWLKKRSVDA